MSLLLLFGGTGYTSTITCSAALVFVVTGTGETVAIVTTTAETMARVTGTVDALAKATVTVDALDLVTTGVKTSGAVPGQEAGEHEPLANPPFDTRLADLVEPAG